MLLSLCITCALLSLLYIAVVVFLSRGLARLSSGSPASPHNLKFSIVIAARNEERAIKRCLNSVLNQTIGASRYQVTLVNDRSTDATASVAGEFAAHHPNLSVVSVRETPAGLSPKKHAVSMGIASAANEIIVFTDADCAVPPTWLETIDRYFDAHTGLVQGITVYEDVAGMNRMFFGLQAVDFLSHGVVAAAAIGAGLPINSNANNFAFRKAAFGETHGYGKLGSVVSGDDDLLLQRIWRSKKWRIRYMADAAGKVTTLPTPTVRGVFEQRKRWGSKTVHYNAGQVCLLVPVFLFYCATVAALVAGFFRPAGFGLCGAMLVVKFLGEMSLMMPGTKLFGELRLRRYIPFASLIQLPLVICAVVLGVFGRFAWKGQRFARTSR
jgi:cellulose synthase/poly-beta-1,6-N-acetylglucosamine synthase-like glycosyltransferase